MSDLHPRSLVEPPPQEMVPKNLTEALVDIGQLKVTCKNQEDKLSEQDDRISEQQGKIAALERVINTANGVRMALFWIASALVGAASLWGIFGSKGK